MNKTIKIAYIGGGSKMWARVFMSDLAIADNLSGEIALYDIDNEASERNAKIGQYINKNSKTHSIFDYKVYSKLEDALRNASFVIISILPGTFKEMRSDVHAPEKYGIYQSVGDSTGPGGVLRAMRTVPIYEKFAKAIKNICPQAWVINLTNPMSICTKTLYDVFPDIKAFGCCHEVFNAQNFLTLVLKETKGIDVDRKQIYTDACGINHFTWITKANYKDIDLLSLIPEFKEKYFEEGYYEKPGCDRFAFLHDPFAYGNKVKMDLFTKYGALAAAGDRHLVEFLPTSWYLKDKETINNWKFCLTTVDYREKDQAEKIAETKMLAEGKKAFELVKSQEEVVELMKAIMGFGDVISNVNMQNKGQMPQMPIGSIVETNCTFAKDKVIPIESRLLPLAVLSLVQRNCANVDLTYEGIKERDLNKIFLAFLNQPLCSALTPNEAKKLFKEMCYNTKEYLEEYFDLNKYFN